MSSGPELQLLIIVYGSSENDPKGNSGQRHEHADPYDQRRVEIEFRPRVPDVSMLKYHSKMQAWANGVLVLLAPDVKHTQKWLCMFCDKPARETDYQMASWMHLNPPKLNVYVHHLCDADHGTCAANLKGVHMMTAISAGQLPPLPSPPGPKLPEDTFPRAASCGYCKREETANANLSRCSKCKLIRYCSPNCQRGDWGRHKRVCKIVKKVEWVWK
ncbi:hypothetical protein K474DRAFT_1666174 [Panus rudis PR-1116 ss-1]|nr:hypothetical protein K474DRAFT_1666174 [Panus rudis PR-1116 ss-1]